MNRVLSLIIITLFCVIFISCSSDNGDSANKSNKQTGNEAKQQKKFELTKESKLFIGKWKAVNPDYPDKPAEWTFKENGKVVTKGMGLTIPGTYNVQNNTLIMKMPQGEVNYKIVNKSQDKVKLKASVMNQTVIMNLKRED